MTISIKQLMEVNSYAVAGELFYDKVCEVMPNDMIEVDMEGVDALPTIFMNTAFLPLIKDYGKKKVMESLRFLKVRKTQMERFRRYFESVDERSILNDPSK